MIHLLDNYTFSPVLRYDAHRLIYTYSEKEEPIQIEGFLGAALLCVRLINSDEGERREIPLDIERKQDFLFSRYEQEVIADGWGYLEAELRQLNDAYIQLTVSQVPIVDVCANIRQFSIAMSLLSAYMQRLVTEEFGEHIWEKETWHMPFSQWLFDAGYTETLRQRFLHIDWTDPVAVNILSQFDKEGAKVPDKAVTKNDYSVVIDLTAVNMTNIIQAADEAYRQTLKIQMNKEIGSPFNITDIVLVPKSGPATDVEHAAEDTPKLQKKLVNGQLVIIKNGVKYNAMGAQL